VERFQRILLGLPGRYGVALIAVFAVLWLRWSLEAILEGRTPLLAFILAVIVASAWGGLGPGLFSTLLSAAVGMLFFVTPSTFFSEAGEWVRLGIFLGEGLVISLVFEGLHRRTQEIRQTLLQLKEANTKLEIARNQLEHAALTDPLTGLGNRRAFEQELLLELGQAKRNLSPLTVMFADIDGLKTINDQEGHERGDALIRAFAEVLRQTLRQGDRIYRFGGDEFAVLLPQVGPADYDSVRSRVSRLIEQLQLRGFPKASASIGLAAFPNEAASPEDLLRLADRLMYSQKETRKAISNV